MRLCKVSWNKVRFSLEDYAVVDAYVYSGGRVDLVLRKQSGNAGTPPVQVIDDPMARSVTFSVDEHSRQSPTDHERPMSKPLQNSSDSEGGEEGSQATLRHATKPASDVELPATPSPGDSAKPAAGQRPTYVRLPSPQTFTSDEVQSAPTESTSSHSNRSASNLKMFDTNFTRTSPSASFSTLNIEVGMPVLVVDDDLLTRTLMKRILTRLGCQVSCAENGEVALEMILGQRISSVSGTSSTPGSDTSGKNAGPILEQQQRQPVSDQSKYAVVFLDNQMPVMSGLRVVEKLRELGRNDFIVGVTGNALLSGSFPSLLEYP